MLKYEIDYLTKDGIRENLVDEEGLPWNSNLYSKAQQAMKDILSRPDVVEARISGMIIVATVRK